MPRLYKTFNLNPAMQEYNFVSNQAFKAKVVDEVRFFIEEGFIICFHWADFLGEADVSPKVWQWMQDPACKGIIACEGVTLPSSLKAMWVAPEGYTQCLYKKLTYNTLEVYIED